MKLKMVENLWQGDVPVSEVSMLFPPNTSDT
jgi:hypothetical protein